MRSANLTALLRFLFLFFFSWFAGGSAFAQENSPYSRYAIGDLVPSQNIVSRGMGGITAGFIDSSGTFPYSPSEKTVTSSSINLSNPASLGSLNTTLFDVGGEIDVRTLRSNVTPDKYTAANTLISYLQLAFPISSKRMIAKREFWNVAFGLRPLTRVNYKIAANSRTAGIDSITTLYEGNGGLNQANISTGIKIKNFSFGLSSGYSFGNKTTSTKIGFNNDSVKYAASNTEVDTRFTGFFLNLGIQYAFRLKNGSVLRIGASTNLQQNLRARRNNVNETFAYNTSSGAVVAIDTVTAVQNQKGTLVVPASYTAGFTYTNDHWLFGADGEYSQWSKFQLYDDAEDVQNSFTVHAGGQYYPAKVNTPASKYWSFVKYRAGAYYGNDYVKLNSVRPDFGITLGAGLPLTSFQRLLYRDFVTLNTGIEVGQHGNRSNTSLRENIFRIDIGFSMTAAWFQKRKYD